MLSATTIKAYIAELVAAFRKIELMDFLRELHTRFNPNQNLSFMEYFLELCSEENEGQFIVHHEKLIEFGVATSDRSNHVKDRLTILGMVEGDDYRLLGDLPDVRQNSSKGGRPKKVYFLTPQTFKLCLMRGQKRSNQTIDVQRYAMYFLFVEKVVYYYAQYESEYKEALLRNKDGVIDSLREELAERDAANTVRMNRLLGYAEETKESLDEVKGQNGELLEKNDLLIEKADALAVGQQVLYQKAVEIQRTVPVKQGNPDREPCMAMTYILYNHKENGPTIRLFPHLGQYKTLRAKLVKMLTGEYSPLTL